MTYWIVWSLDTREPVLKDGVPHRYKNGVLVPVDVTKRQAFSYFAMGRSTIGSIWVYERREAERFPNLKAAVAARRMLFEMFRRPDRPFDRPIQHYGISKITSIRRMPHTSIRRMPHAKGETK